MPAKHYYIFNSPRSMFSLDKEGWDLLRTGTDNPAFQFETTQADYEANCVKRADCHEVAKTIKLLIKSLDANVSSVISLGAGKGIVEWHLKKLLPDMPLICTDYAESGVASLRRLFRACDRVMVFDMLKGDYSAFGEDAILLMNRVSTEFTSTEWQQIFRACKASGIKRILFMPTELASIRLKVMETLRHFVRKILGRRDTFCGWLYSKRELESLMSKCYNIEKCVGIENSALYLLSRRD